MADAIGAIADAMGAVGDAIGSERRWRRVWPVDEVAGDPALRAYGVALAAVAAIVAVYWRVGGRLAAVFAPDSDALCWPIMQGCQGWRAMVAGHVDAVVYGMLIGAALAALCFAGRRTVGLGCLLLVVLKAVEVAVLLADYRLRANQHYMALFALVAFLVVPGRRDAVRLVLVAFYVAAGVLKLDAEWVSGAALYAPPWFFGEQPWLTAACVYVIALELAVVWGLLARRRWVFWGALAQVVVFHVFSWPIVGFFYPLLMLGLLAIFPLCRRWPLARPSLLARAFTGRASLGAYAIVAVFAALQCVPAVIAGDEAITGEGRLAALHMFDARVACRSYVLVHSPGRVARPVSLNGRLSTRIGCDPWVVLSRARAVCDAIDAHEADPPRVDLRHFAGRATDVMRTVARVDDICRAPVEYRPFGRNAWLQLDGEPWPPTAP